MLMRVDADIKAEPLPRANNVVDTGFLYALTMPVLPPDSENPVRLYDVLPYLAGHKILIPEMVSVEAGRVLRDRSAIPESLDMMQGFLGSCSRVFLQQGTTTENSDIIPPSKKDGSLSALYITRLWHIMSNKNLSGQQKRVRIADLDRQSPNRANYGEQAAFEVIKSLDRSIHKSFWSNDKTALDQAEALGAHMVTTASFIGALSKRGIWRAIGIKASAAQLLDLMVNYSKQAGLCSAGLVDDSCRSSEARREVFKQTLQPIKPAAARNPTGLCRRQTALDGVRSEAGTAFAQPGF